MIRAHFDLQPGPNCGGDIRTDWLAEFEAAARRPLEARMKYSFIRTYKPVLDDEPYRSFNTMDEYRRWCEENLPDWLGYGRANPPPCQGGGQGGGPID